MNGTPSSATKRKRTRRATAGPSPSRILVVDVGGTSVKLLATGQSTPRRIRSGPRMTPTELVEGTLAQVADWSFDAVSIGYPGLVGPQGPRSEPGNLGAGWVGFNFAAAFDRPVRITNDAAMQALGSYEGGRMLFLGLGTGLGSTLIAQNVIVPLELGGLPWKRRQLWQMVGRDGLKRYGLRAWRKHVTDAVVVLTAAFSVDYVVLGGGNAKRFKRAAGGTRISNNLAAFRGGFRLWNLPDVTTLSAEEAHVVAVPTEVDWRVI